MTAAVVIIFLPLYIYYDTCLISVFDTVRLKLQSDNQIVYKYVTYIYIFFEYEHQHDATLLGLCSVTSK